MWGHFYGFSFLSFGISSLIRWQKRPAAMGVKRLRIKLA